MSFLRKLFVASEPPGARPVTPVMPANPDGRWAGLENAVQRVVDEADADNHDFCVTVESKANSSAWFQITWDSLNFAYPMTTEPLTTIAAMNIGLPDKAVLVSYEPGSYVTIENGSEDSAKLAGFIYRYFQAVFQITLSDQTATISVENL
jgi:hypothetical protein